MYCGGRVINEFFFSLGILNLLIPTDFVASHFIFAQETFILNVLYHRSESECCSFSNIFEIFMKYIISLAGKESHCDCFAWCSLMFVSFHTFIRKGIGRRWRWTTIATMANRRAPARAKGNKHDGVYTLLVAFDNKKLSHVKTFKYAKPAVSYFNENVVKEGDGRMWNKVTGTMG